MSFKIPSVGKVAFPFRDVSFQIIFSSDLYLVHLIGRDTSFGKLFTSPFIKFRIDLVHLILYLVSRNFHNTLRRGT